jgi:hypothetical protein
VILAALHDQERDVDPGQVRRAARQAEADLVKPAEAAVSELISVEKDPPDLATLTWDALATAATARRACSGHDHG